MAKFNAVKQGIKTTSYESGEAFLESVELGLISLLVTSMLTDKFYENEGKIKARVSNYWDTLKTTKEGREFFMKAACYTRYKFNLRSISHLCASLVAISLVNNVIPAEEKSFTKKFFTKIIIRPDDITEIISCYSSLKGAHTSKNGRIQLPALVKKAFSKAMANYDNYLLAKYKQSKNEISMIDAIRMCHTKHTSTNGESINLLLKGELKNEKTWQALSSAAGKSGKTKQEVWEEFLNKEKVEYFSLLRNIRNILENSTSKMRVKAATLLADERHIKKSRLLPFRFLQAYNALEEMRNIEGCRTLQNAVNKAINLSVNNVPEFDGRTCIIVDISGSMLGNYWDCYNRTFQNNPITIAALFASALYKKNTEADMVLFNNYAEWYSPNANDNIITLSKDIIKKCGGGTNTHEAFDLISKRDYDRIILLSDHQGWGGDVSANKYWNMYKRTHANAKLFSFDLAGYGTITFPEQDVFCMAGYSDHVFEIMNKLDKDKKYFVKEVMNFEI